MHSTVLLTACSGILRERLASLVPPQVEALGPQSLCWRREAATLVWEWDMPSAALAQAQEILPCLSILSPAVRGYVFTLAYRTAGTAQSRLIGLDPLGHWEGPVPGAADAAQVEPAIDVFVVRTALTWARLRLTVQTSDAAQTEAAVGLVSVSIRRTGDAGALVTQADSTADGVALPVPARSQMELSADLAHRTCSPTCVSMVLDGCGRRNDVYDVVAQVRHAVRDLYGVWPANVQAAARWGVLGYLLHVPTWAAARHLLDAGVPLVASVRYEEGELRDAAVRRTSGHLIVVRGYAPGVVLVNDPAAQTAAGVERAHDLQEFAAVWLGKGGVTYVLFPA